MTHEEEMERFNEYWALIKGKLPDVPDTPEAYRFAKQIHFDSFEMERTRLIDKIQGINWTIRDMPAGIYILPWQLERVATLIAARLR